MSVIHRIPAACALLASCLVAGPALAQGAPMPSPAASGPAAAETRSPAVANASRLERAEGLFLIDYQTVPVRGGETLDLIGFHILTRMNDWLHLGIGGHAPLFRGAYGGFMAFDVTAHAQRRIFGPVFANAGVSLGGGGGGKSVQQSRTLSGTGGFVKAYAGLGVDFDGFSVGANVARMKFKDSAIDHSQLNVYFQKPFSYVLGSYSGAGERLDAAERSELQQATSDSIESILTLGLDNLFQIDPQGTNKRTINLIDLQYAHFVSPGVYWYFNAAGGYRGRPLYNQAFGGLGYRAHLSPRFKLYGQFGIGSGGYAPETIDTGPGLLLYPKVSAEVMLDRHLGLALSAGYLVAPKGSSKNVTVGAALNYHIRSGEGSAGADGALLRGYRFNLYQQTETGVVFRGAEQPDVHLLTMQIDTQLGPHLYIPVQVGAAYNAYLNLPGYGELLTGVGVQSRFRKGDRFQVFGQLLVGANPHGVVYKTGLGLNLSLSDRWALYGVAGQTFAGLGEKKNEFRSDYAGVGLSYRFSVPNR
jgi:hypothetical protein